MESARIVPPEVEWLWLLEHGADWTGAEEAIPFLRELSSHRAHRHGCEGAVCICDKETLDLPQAVRPISRAQSPRPASDAATDGGGETESAYGCCQGLLRPKGLLPGCRIRANQRTFPTEPDNPALETFAGWGFRPAVDRRALWLPLCPF